MATARRLGQMLLPFKPRTGPEPKPVLFQVQDHEGTFYDVFDSRPTKHGFNLLFGFPARWHRRIFTKFGKPGLIHTAELIAFWEKHRAALNINFDLPAGNTTLTRARSKLGFNQVEEYKTQWVERIPELKSLPTAEIAKKYNVSPETVGGWRRTLLGAARSARVWQQDPKVVDLLRSPLSPKEVAEKLGLAAWEVRSMRGKLPREPKLAA